MAVSWRGIGALLVFALVPAACASSASSSPSSTVPAFADAIALATKLGCHDYTSSKPVAAAAGQSTEPRTDGGGCTIDGHRVTIAIFADDEHLGRYVALQKAIGCGIGASTAAASLHYVTGPHWYVASAGDTDASAAAKLRTLLGGGTQATITCS